MSEETKSDSQDKTKQQTETAAEQEQLGEIALTEDKGVTKTILTPAPENAETPQDTMEVTVNYIGRLLDDTVFDKSQTPFKFVLGANSVIKGWEIGVKSMKKGEKCQLFCTAPYAYGDSSKGEHIKPNSTLKFEIELLDMTFEALTKNKQIRKFVLTQSEEYETPSYGTRCNVNIVGKSNGKVFLDETNKEMISNEDLEPAGMTKILDSMKKGEKTRFFLYPGKYHYREDFDKIPEGVGRSDVLEFVVEMISFKTLKPTYQMSELENFTSGKKAKEKGNFLFKKSRFRDASKCYKFAISCFNSISKPELDPEMSKPLLSDDNNKENQSIDNDNKENRTIDSDNKKDNSPTDLKLKEEGQVLLLATLNNMAMTKSKLEKWEKVIEFCDKALTTDDKNLKALCRKAEAKAVLGEFEEAIKTIDSVAEKSKTPYLKRKRAEIMRKKLAADKTVDSFYQRMAGGFGSK